jgi:GH24 family phage-related lysozyme (muramidase)
VIDPRLLADLKRAEDAKHVEGTNFIAYRDTRGYWTGPFGHLLDQSIDWTGQEWSQSTGDSILTADIAERTYQVLTLPEWTALDTPCRQNAILECVFNLGLGHWVAEFPKTRASIRAQSWTIAAANLLASPEWIAQVGRSRVARIAGYLAAGSYSQ